MGVNGAQPSREDLLVVAVAPADQLDRFVGRDQDEADLDPAEPVAECGTEAALRIADVVEQREGYSDER